jgi:hypothetical protein
MTRTPFDELVHRVNNLLGTIELQAELAAATAPGGASEALRHIVESARRTQRRTCAPAGAQRGDGTVAAHA